jgi:hypothetical protein
MDDKRKFRRFQLNINSSLIKDNTEASPIPVIVADASFGGMGLIAPEDFSVGTLVTLTWERPPFASNRTVCLKSRIVSSRRKPAQPGKFAVNTAFLNPDRDLVQQILHWAQMQALIQAKARVRTSAAGKARGSPFY